MTLSNASLKSFGSSEAPTSRAMSIKRLWRSASVSLESDEAGFLLGAFFTCPDIFSPLILAAPHNHSGGSSSQRALSATRTRIRRLFCERRFKRGNACLQHGNLLAISKDASKRVFGRQQPFRTTMSLDR